MATNAAPLAALAPEVGYFLSPEAKEKRLTFQAPRAGDAGFDLPCLFDTVLPGKSLITVRTGIHLAIPQGWVGLVRDRSSVSLRGAATVAGVIDASYRGEVKVVIHNHSEADLVFRSGDRIAQCVVLPHFVGEVIEAASLEELGNTDRGAGGFGSTGS